MRAIHFGLAIGLATLGLAAQAQAQFMTNYPVIIVPPPPAENMIKPKPASPKPRPPASNAPSPQQDSPEGSDFYQGRTRVR